MISEHIAVIVFAHSLKWLDELKAAPTPLPYGLAQRFKALIPERDMTELYAALPKQEFVAKKGKR